MRPSKTRYVTACQQLLALGAVLAVLTPAATVISLDVVQQAPRGTQRASGGHPVAHLSAYTREAQRTTLVPTAPVEAEVDEYRLTAAPGSKVAPGALDARTKIGALDGGDQLVSTPEPVTGYGAVGVTWDHDARVPADTLTFQARTKTGDTWSTWLELPYDADHAPDPNSAEGRNARPGTDVLLVGKVDQVQVRSTSTVGNQPADMKLAVIAPGKPSSTARELPAIQTDDDGIAEQNVDGQSVDGQSVDGQSADESADESAEERVDTSGEGEGMALSAATYTPKPVIYSRAQWGANESLRDKGSLHYFEIHAGFVHHTVNANGYSRSEVPGILRGIYAYHTQSRGWSDVGYNFLVDRFGRIWEGRAGGVDRPVVGAHTLGYNDYAFAMSAIGNYETARPSKAVLQAYGSLFAWKLSLHGIDASSTKQVVGPDTFQAINGHRDAGSTACPGKYLYAKIPKIRTLAAEAQQGWDGRQLESDLASTAHPDLIVRRASDGRGFIIPTGGLLGFGSPRTSAGAWAGASAVVGSPDLTGDGHGDIVVQATDGSAVVRPANANGFGAPIQKSDTFAHRDLITAVGDLDEDGNNDLVGRNTETGHLNAYLGRGTGSFERASIPGDWLGYNKLAATGDLDGDGHVDLLARDKSGNMWRFPGTGTRAFGTPVKLAGTWDKYDTITGYGDFSRDGRPDLVVRASGGQGYVLPGDGAGRFGHALGPYASLEGLGAISGGGNLVGNAAPDLVARKGNDLVTYTHNGGFDTGRPIDTGMNLSSANAVLNAGDWDRDGFGDVMIRKASDGQLKLRRGDGKGGFSAPVRIASSFNGVKLLAAVGDMTGDGWPDLMGQPTGGSMRIYPGHGLDGLRTSYAAHSPIDARRQVPVGRWDGDGAPDSLFRDGSKLTLFRGNGPGGFSSPKGLGADLAPYDWVIGVSDVNLTGHPDLLVRHKSTGYLYLLRASSSGFSARRFVGEGMNQYDLAG
jgi:hypothetical protein